MRLVNKVAFVSGGARGMGAAEAIHYITYRENLRRRDEEQAG